MRRIPREKVKAALEEITQVGGIIKTHGSLVVHYRMDGGTKNPGLKGSKSLAEGL